MKNQKIRYEKPEIIEFPSWLATTHGLSCLGGDGCQPNDTVPCIGFDELMPCNPD